MLLQRISVASTSTTFFTYEEAASTVSTSTAPNRRRRRRGAQRGSSRRRSASVASTASLTSLEEHGWQSYDEQEEADARFNRKGKGRQCTHDDEELSMTRSTRRSHERENSSDISFSDTEADEEEYPNWDGEGYEGEDQLDRLIRMTSAILRVSKGILSSAKRLGVAEAAISQMPSTREDDLRSHLTTLERQDRHVGTVSSSAHLMLNPRPVLSPEAPLPRLRHNRSGSAADLNRARTIYVNASSSGNSVLRIDDLDALFEAPERNSAKRIGRIGDDEAEVLASPTSYRPSAAIAKDIPPESQPDESLAGARMDGDTASPQILHLPPLTPASPSPAPTSGSTFFSSFWSKPSASPSPSLPKSADRNWQQERQSRISSPSSFPLGQSLLGSGSSPKPVNTAEQPKNDAQALLSALASSSSRAAGVNDSLPARTEGRLSNGRSARAASAEPSLSTGPSLAKSMFLLPSYWSPSRQPSTVSAQPASSAVSSSSSSSASSNLDSPSAVGRASALAPPGRKHLYHSVSESVLRTSPLALSIPASATRAAPAKAELSTGGFSSARGDKSVLFGDSGGTREGSNSSRQPDALRESLIRQYAGGRSEKESQVPIVRQSGTKPG